MPTNLPLNEFDDPDLARFAEEFRAQRPALSEAALARIKLSTQNAMARATRERTRANWNRAGLAAAAVLLIAIFSGLLKSTTQPARSMAIREKPARIKAEKGTLLADFSAAADTSKKLALLPKIEQAYDDAELPQDVRYLLALELARKHMTWHPAAPNDSMDRIKIAEETHIRFDDRWQDAHTGEPWMTAMLDAAELERIRRERDRPRGDKKNLAKQEEKNPPLYWRLTDPSNADVVRSLSLLDSISDPGSKLATHARRWAAELRRNNTVITFDLPGGYVPGENGPLVMDARNADKVAFTLYRVHSASELSTVAARIGDDFIYRDYGLRDGAVDKMERARQMQAELAVMEAQHLKERPALPAFTNDDVVDRWDVDVVALSDVGAMESLDDWDDMWDEVDEESNYFDDMCQYYRDRLNKHYRQKTQSAWQCGKVSWIPKKALAAPGGYVLLAEANGQKAYAPIIVSPLSLTLRRCRDGVFALVSDATGTSSVAGATLTSPGSLKPEITDSQGAAFLHVFASGDRPIVAEKNGRYAIAGFGKVFEGLYVNESQSAMRSIRGGLSRFHEIAAKKTDEDAAVFADRTVVAAYTDRPTYRPGQQVQFKLIVRTLATNDDQKNKVPNADAFRAAEFDLDSQLRMLPEGTAVSFDVINPRGRVAAHGSLTLNDFGTAAGSFDLSSEEPVGAYSLRLHLNNSARVVPHVFAVKYYRRPNFQISLSGVPAIIDPGGHLQIALKGNYYFGKPVSGGTVDARLVRMDSWVSLAQAGGTVIDTGDWSVFLELPKALSPGKYAVVCSLRDESGQTVTRSEPCEVRGKNGITETTGLASLPRFIKQGTVLTIKTSASQIAIERPIESGTLIKKVVNNSVAIHFALPGWHALSADNEHARIFVYGGREFPEETQLPEVAEVKKEGENIDTREPRWVNLTRYNGENYDEESDDRWDDSWDREENHLLVLFDKYHAQVGQKLAVLVYAPEPGRILFTIEGQTVVDYLVAEIPRTDSSYHVIEIPIKERHLPNFYLQGRILATINVAALSDQAGALQELKKLEEKESDRGEDPRWCRVDVVDVNQKSAANEKLNVEIKTDQAEYYPGDPVDVTLRVTGRDGAPRAAEISLAAIDESIFSFGEDSLDSLASLFASARPERGYVRKTWRNYQARQWTSVHALEMARQQLDKAMAQAAQQAQDSLKKLAESQKLASEAIAAAPATRELSVPLESFGEMPVGSISIARIRSDFRETAAWLPQLRTGADGIARTKFKLPDSLTSYRLSAVGLTRETELGTGRAKIKASLPLSVQVFVPRFAVETDRLEFAALIHNNTAEARECQASWEISGLQAEDGNAPVQKLTVAPGQIARVPVWVTATRAGKATVIFRVGDIDAEQRELQILPIGRAREVALNGAFNASHRLEFPAGFAASDLSISMTRGTAAQAMDGLAYIVDYPYGCVEQTMSRFLPAVVVREAIQQAPIALPPDVAAKLPRVIAQGLTRIYNFQHEDGGWGWWEKDETNRNMTVYVAYGLARCKLSGTGVDQTVLDRACAYLKKELVSGGLGKRESHFAHGGMALDGRDIEARAWLVLALAGAAQKEQLAAHVRAKPAASMSLVEQCNLALACKSAGLVELGKSLADAPVAPKSTEELALVLNVKLAYDTPLKECNLIAVQLLTRRFGQRWESTQATSYAIEALAQMLRFNEGDAVPKSARISLGGQRVLDITTPAALKEFVYRAHVNSSAIPQLDSLPIEMIVDGSESVHYAITATGTQRLDKIEPIGDTVKLARSYWTLDDKPLDRPARVGETIAAKLVVDLKGDQSYVITEDRRPAGFEFADDRIFGRDAGAAANVEFRDDRVCIFHTALAAGRHEFTYYLRAETPGTSHVLPGCVYPMYQESTRGETGSNSLEVR